MLQRARLFRLICGFRVHGVPHRYGRSAGYAVCLFTYYLYNIIYYQFSLFLAETLCSLLRRRSQGSRPLRCEGGFIENSGWTFSSNGLCRYVDR